MNIMMEYHNVNIIMYDNEKETEKAVSFFAKILT